MAFLDNIGLSYFWQKLKEKLAGKADLNKPNTYTMTASDTNLTTLEEIKLNDKLVLRFSAEDGGCAWLEFFNRGVYYGRLGFKQGEGMAFEGSRWIFPEIYVGEVKFSELVNRVTALETALATKQDKIDTWGDLKGGSNA